MNGEKVSFRVSMLPTYYGEKTVMRLLRENVSGFTLEYLGFHGEGLEAYSRGGQKDDRHDPDDRPDRLNGKVTTLYTILDIVNTPGRQSISTIEDPIEYQHERRIYETQVRPEIGFSFADGLRTLVLPRGSSIVIIGSARSSR